MKRRMIGVLVAVVLLTCFVTTSFAAPRLPNCGIDLLTESELSDFIDATGDSGMIAVLEAISEEAEIYALKYTANETDSEVNSYYDSYIADFELVANKDCYVFLLGNYGSYGTLPAGIFKLEAGEPIYTGLNLSYNFLRNSVGVFSCAAVLVTEEAIAAVEEFGLSGSEFDEAFANPAEQGTTLTLTLKMYGDGLDEDGTPVGSGPYTFRYGRIEEEPVPETGDNSHLALWSGMLIAALGGITLTAKKRRGSAR